MCVDGVNDFRCVCRIGFIGKDCVVNIDDCVNDFCRYNVICVDLVNDYNCSCLKGYIGKDCYVNVNVCVY